MKRFEHYISDNDGLIPKTATGMVSAKFDMGTDEAFANSKKRIKKLKLIEHELAVISADVEFARKEHRRGKNKAAIALENANDRVSVSQIKTVIRRAKKCIEERDKEGAAKYLGKLALDNKLEFLDIE